MCHYTTSSVSLQESQDAWVGINKLSIVRYIVSDSLSLDLGTGHSQEQ